MTTILDVAIGLGLVYLIFSLLCTALQESIGAFLQLRARTLYDGVIGLIDGNETRLPWWIDWARKMVGVLVMPATATSGVAKGFLAHPFVTQLSDSRTFPASIPPDRFAIALIEALVPRAGALEPITPAAIRASIEALPASPFQRTLATLWREGGDSVDAFRAAIERWFGDMLERIKAQFARTAHVWAFAIGLVVAVAADVDTLRIGQALVRDADLRATMAKLAEAAVENETLRDAARTSTLSEKQKEAVKDFVEKGLGAEIGRRRLPIGHASLDEAIRSIEPLRLIGWVISAIALSLGAQFWFDLLARLVSFRSGGRRPESGARGGGI